MKMTIKFFCLLMAVFLSLSGCSRPNSPKAIAKAGLEQMKKGNYDKAFKIFFGDPKTDQEKEFMTMFSQKISQSAAKQEGLKSYTIGDEIISEYDPDRAKVEAVLIYGNGNQDDSGLKFKRDDQGVWRLDIGK